MSNFLFGLSNLNFDTSKPAKLLTNEDYDNITKKVIKYVVRNKGSLKLFMKNEDIFNEVKTAIMIADWKYDDTKNMRRSSYRMQCAIWATKGIYRRMMKPRTESLDSKYDTSTANSIQDIRYEKQKLRDNLAELVDDTKLNEQEKTCVQRLVEGYKINEIAQEFGTSNTWVYKVVNNLKSKLSRNAK